jgi:hypothetical protein
VRHAQSELGQAVLAWLLLRCVGLDLTGYIAQTMFPG